MPNLTTTGNTHVNTEQTEVAPSLHKNLVLKTYGGLVVQFKAFTRWNGQLQAPAALAPRQVTPTPDSHNAEFTLKAGTEKRHLVVPP
jgi:hypothetical protein